MTVELVQVVGQISILISIRGRHTISVLISGFFKNTPFCMGLEQFTNVAYTNEAGLHLTIGFGSAIPFCLAFEFVNRHAVCRE